MLYSLTVSIYEGDSERQFNVEPQMSLDALEDVISQVIDSNAKATEFVFSVQQYTSTNASHRTITKS